MNSTAPKLIIHRFMNTSVILTALLLCIAGITPLHAADKPKGKAYVYKHSAGQPRKMEVYFPPNHDPAKAKVPGLILFHGGAWLGGSLDEFRDTCAYFAARGLVCATVDYQMLKMKKADAGKLPPGESHKRVCVTDAKSAIRWFKQHAADFGMDPARIITGGTSAGGHISALATMNSADLNDPADPKDIDTSVVAYLWINPAFQGNDANTPAIDIMRHMKADLPHTIVFFGELDGYKKSWGVVHAKWESLGAKTIELQIAPGEGHGFCTHKPDWNIAAMIAMDRFLVKRGLLTGEPTLKMPESGVQFVPDP